MTDAERKLWWGLRDSRVEGLKFRRQVPFGPFFLDFYCARHRMALELDGGGHYHPDEQASDRRRTLYLQSEGITVLRYSDRDVLMSTESVVEDIIRRVKNPHPTPLLFKERE
jgi:adenine-specific DNA-methyltransferase